MAYPTSPDLDYSYTGFEQSLGDGSFPGTQLDNDLANVKTAIDQIIDFIEFGFRSDNRLTNRSVRAETLAPGLVIGTGAPQVWATGTQYAPPDAVAVGNALYRCEIAHTSTSFATDLAAGKWFEIIDMQAAIDDAEAAAAAAAASAQEAEDTSAATVSAATAAAIAAINSTRILGVASATIPHFGFAETGNNSGFGSSANDVLYVMTAGTTRVEFRGGYTLFLNQLRGQVGSTPAYSFDGDENTGWGSNAADTLTARVGGTDRLEIADAGMEVLNDRLKVTGNAQAHVLLQDSGAGGDQKVVRLRNNDGSFRIQSVDDAEANPVDAIVCNRGSGTAWNSVEIYTGGARAMHVNSNRTVLIGDDGYTGAITDAGCKIEGAGAGVPGSVTVVTDAATALLINRQNDDGDLVRFHQGGTLEGAIAVSGTTISYGSFSGYHWSQLGDLSAPAIPRGTIVETIDAMCSWPGEANEQLARFKVSDTAASTAVYGVFMGWSANSAPDGMESPSADAMIVSLGAFLVRIASGETVARGDLIESNGDGCGRPQADDIVRSSTVGKVTAAVAVETYGDGSYLVPCVLCCG